ncbi:hypothetical protein D9M71_736510 [compost metagenome]
MALLVLAVIGIPLTKIPPEKLLLCVVLLLATCHVFLFCAYLKLQRESIEKGCFHIKGGSIFAVTGVILTLTVIIACFQLDIEVLSSLASIVALIAINYLLRKATSVTSLEKSENV